MESYTHGAVDADFAGVIGGLMTSGGSARLLEHLTFVLVFWCMSMILKSPYLIPFDLEIEKTARRLRKKTKQAKLSTGTPSRKTPSPASLPQ